MSALVPDAADEGTHEHDEDLLWSESHYLDAVSSDGGTGVYVRHGRLPNQVRSHVMLAVVRPGVGPVILADDRAPLPELRGRDVGLSADAYDLDLTCADPLRHVRVVGRGRATAHDHPADALSGAHGHPVDIDLDLAWTTDAVPFRWRITTRYEIPCRVTGQVTVDGQRIDVDWVGQRDHSWGQRDWWAFDWCWLAVHLEDGSRWHSAAIAGIPTAGTGYLQRVGHVVELNSVDAIAEPTPDGLFGPTTVRMGPIGRTLHLRPVAFAPVRMASDAGKVSYFPRATCQVTTDDGRHGIGWMEWNRVQN